MPNKNKLLANYSVLLGIIKDKYIILNDKIYCGMSNPYFSFKKFTVYHDLCAMKVGTDGVLLGAWANVADSRKVLDIGTGTGLLALMVAQRNEKANITAIDVDKQAVKQAKNNVFLSPWSNRIEVVQADATIFESPVLYDTILSNPPYFVDSLKGPDEQRNMSRHSDALPAWKLIDKVAELLTLEGSFSMIIPFEQTDDFVDYAKLVGLHLSRHTRVSTRIGLPPKRSLLEFKKTFSEVKMDELTIELSRHVYTEEYIHLTKDFYLKM